MLKDVVPFDRVWAKAHASSLAVRSLISFINFLEQRLGGEFAYDMARIGYESADLVDLFELAETFRARGIITSYEKLPSIPDEPRVVNWYAECGTSKHATAKGSALDDERRALTTMLGEALERYVWFESADPFAARRNATVEEMRRKNNIEPARFASYGKEQRAKNGRLRFAPDCLFAWVKGYSWTGKKPVWIPAQVVSGNKKLCAFSPLNTEPAIRPSITTGLAVHPVRIHALLSGALEVIERDAYVITWLNRISPPRVDTEELSKRNGFFARLVEQCRRHRFEPHILRFPTDAPAYALGAVLEDKTGNLPRFSFGLKAGADPAVAAEGALLEALRAHRGTREQGNGGGSSDMKPKEVGQYGRLLYWAQEGYADRLAFLIEGDARPLGKEAWGNDADEAHFARIAEWCRTRGYELASASLTGAAANVPGWHIEFVVIPELQPLYYDETLPPVGGARLSEIPRQFGYAPRDPYLDEPHPFA